MPHRPARPCAHSRCPARAVNGSRYCADHKPTESRTPDSRPSAARRGYDRKWRRVRALYLKSHPYCVICSEPSTEVDHILSLKDGGTHQWDNLQAMCKVHHSQKTAAIDGSFGRPTWVEKARGGG